MLKDEKMFDKYMTTWENVSNIIKKINSGLIYNKKYLKAEKRFNAKESFQCFYVPVILFDSVYRKDRNYYLEVFLEKVKIYEKVKFWRDCSWIRTHNHLVRNRTLNHLLQILGVLEVPPKRGAF